MKLYQANLYCEETNETTTVGIFPTELDARRAIEFYLSETQEISSEWNEYNEYRFNDDSEWGLVEDYELGMIAIL